MTVHDDLSLESLPPDVGARIDAACDRFEAAWQTGGRPRVAEFATESGGPARAVQLRELVSLDVRYRQKADELPLTADYAPLFPDGVPEWLPRTAVDRAGRYRFVEPVGKGGMGVIFRATDPDLGREVAVKVLKEDERDNLTLRARFVREARVTARLQHPNIPAVHEHGQLADGRPYFAMKLIRGRNLNELLGERPEGSQNVSRWLPVFAAVCQAAGYAHSKGVVHRDLKPHNVMVGEFGEVQVLDWGLARDLGERPIAPGARPRASRPRPSPDDRDVTPDYLASASVSTGGRTVAGDVLGTVAYMSPEQARGELDRVDQRSDVFALGGVLCTILTGSPPFAAPDAWMKAQSADLTDAFARLDECGADAELVDLCKRCLAADSADRPPDGGAVAKLVTHLTRVAERQREAELSGERRRVQAAAERPRLWLYVALVSVAAVVATTTTFGLYVLYLWPGSGGMATGMSLVKEKPDAGEKQANTQPDRTADPTAPPIKQTMDSVRRLVLQGSVSPDDLLDSAMGFFNRTPGFVAGVPSPDAERVVGVGMDGAVCVWDAPTGKVLFTLGSQAGPMRCAAYNADGSRLVTAGWDGVARVWDAKDGRELVALKGHERPVTAVAFNPDGTRVVTASLDHSARLWDAVTGKELRTFAGHTDALTCAAISHDGKYVATGSRDNTVGVWDTATGKELRILGHTAQVTTVAFSPAGGRIATGSADMTVKVWDAATGAELITKPHKATVTSVAFSPDGVWVASAGHEPSVRLWEAATGDHVRTLNAHTGPVASVAFRRDGKLVTASEDRTVRLWDATNGVVLPAFTAPAPEPRTVAAPAGIAGGTPRGSASVTGKFSTGNGTDGGVRVWEGPKAEKEVAQLKGHAKAVGWASFSPDGKRIVTANADLTARVWDAATGAEQLVLQGHAKKVVTAEFSSDGKYVLTASDDGTAKVWDAAKGTELLTLGDPGHALKTAALSLDGGRVVTVCQDRTVRVWDVSGIGTAPAGRAPPLVLKGMAEPPVVAWFDSTGTRVFAVGIFGSVWGWDVPRAGGASAAEKVYPTKNEHLGMTKTVGVSPDRTRVVLSLSDSLRVVNVTTRVEQVVVRKGLHADAVAFTPDGSQVVTGDQDGVVRVWDLNSGAAVGKELVLPRKAPTTRVTAVALSSVGPRVVVASEAWTSVQSTSGGFIPGQNAPIPAGPKNSPLPTGFPFPKGVLFPFGG